MALRLPHVLVLMALLLAAGVLSVRTIPGGPLVQGTLAVDVPGLTPAVAQRLQAERGDLRWSVLPAGDGPLAPFDDALVAGHVERGSIVALFVQPPQPAPPPAGWRPVWRVLLAPETGDVVGSLAEFVRAQSGTRPFLAGLVLPPGVEPDPELLDPLLAAADALPAFRRTSVVLLGERTGAGGRVVVRLDRGQTARATPATLTDLLETEPGR